jgi:hypothetical protein
MQPVTAEITFDSIYDDSSCRIVMTSFDDFKAEFSGELLKVHTGTLQGNALVEAEKDGSRYKIDVDLIRWVFERKIDNSVTGFRTSNQYGMRFFPFVSSSIKGHIAVKNNKISVAIIELPDKYRFIRTGIEVFFGKSGNTRTLHDRGEDKSRYIFLPDDRENLEDRLNVDIPVRLGGNALLRITEFPIYYGIISFLAVALAALTKDGRVVVASLVAVYSFMLRHWLNSNPPQRSVLLTNLYTFTGIVLVIWGLAWFFLSYWAGCLLPVILWMFMKYLKAVRGFSFTGMLPNWLQDYWQSQIDKAEAKQIAALKNKK